jgi:flagellar protein FliO/FliZ
VDRFPPMTALSRLRARAADAPLDRAPLRRAGVLAVLLVLLLIAGRALGPGGPAPDGAAAGRQSVQAEAERVSARPGPSLWTPGRVAALVLLAAGGGFAFVLHRRSAPAATASAIRVVETHTLGPGQSLRLVACGGEVLLLGVTGEGTRVLRHWPRDAFEEDGARGAPPARFADALAARLADVPETPTPDALTEPSERAFPSWTGGARGGRLSGAPPPPDGRDVSASGTDSADDGVPRRAGLPPPRSLPPRRRGGTPPAQGEDSVVPAEPVPLAAAAGAPLAGRPHALRQFAAGRA